MSSATSIKRMPPIVYAFRSGCAVTSGSGLTRRPPCARFRRRFERFDTGEDRDGCQSIDPRPERRTASVLALIFKGGRLRG